MITETYPPEINGVALTMQSLVTGLRQLDHHVAVIRPRQPQADQAEPPHEYLVPSLPVPWYQGLRFGLPMVKRLKSFLSQAQPDAIYIATEGPLGWAGLRAAQALGRPVSSGFHTRFDQYAAHYGLGFLSAGISRYLRCFHNATCTTLVPTRALQHDLTERGYRNVLLLERAVDTDLFSPRKRGPQLRRQWGLDDDDLAILYVGRLAAEKNLTVATRAFRAIQEQTTKARFIIVGDGPARAELQHNNPDFIFCGMRSGTELAAHYASADLFLFPSLTETFGNVVLEALASGLPVVAFDRAAAADFIHPGRNGLLAAPGDTDTFLRHARALSNQVGKLPNLCHHARHSVRHLAPVNVAHKLSELLGNDNKA